MMHHRRKARKWRLSRWLGIGALVAVSVALGACIKVRHLGESTGKAFHSVFSQQSKAGSETGEPKGMEAELGKVATTRMTRVKRPEANRPSLVQVDHR